MITNTNIEILAVSEVNKYLSWSNYMVPYIGTSTTFPVWDGDLIVYEPNKEHNSNKHIDRIIRVQVKGHLNKNDESFLENITYTVPVPDLNLYRRNGGVAYFVVCFNETTQESKIYQSLLTPEQLKKYIREAKRKKKTQITLNVIPEDRQIFYCRCLDFLRDCRLQNPYQDSSLSPINIISNALSFNLSGPGSTKDEILDYNVGNKVHLYNTFNLGGRTVQVPTGIEGEIQNVHCEKQVSINGVVWYKKIKRAKFQDVIIYSIADVLSIVVNAESKQLAWVGLYNGTPYLSTILKAKDFVKNLLKYKLLKINEDEYNIDFSDSKKGIEQLLFEAQLLRDILNHEGFNDDIRLINLNVGRDSDNEICLICKIDDKQYNIKYPGINWSSLMQAT